MEALERAGLTVVGEEGTPEEVTTRWKPFISAGAVPAVRIPDSAGDDPLESVERAWSELADALGLISASGEFLISVAGPGASRRPWYRVRAGRDLRVRELGHTPDEPEFVSSSLDRSVAIAVSTEEYEFWLLSDPHVQQRTTAP